MLFDFVRHSKNCLSYFLRWQDETQNNLLTFSTKIEISLIYFQVIRRTMPVSTSGTKIFEIKSMKLEKYLKNGAERIKPDSWTL